MELSAQSTEPPIQEPEWLAKLSTCDQLKSEIRSRFGAVSDLSKFDEPKRSELELVIHVACGERFAGCRFKVCKERTSSSSSSSSADFSSANFSEQVSSLRALTAAAATQIELAPLSSSSSSVEMVSSVVLSSQASSSEASSSAASVDDSVELSSSSSAVEDSTPPVSIAPDSISPVSGAPASIVPASAASSSRPSPFIVDPLAWLTKEMSCDQFLEQAQVRFGFFGSYENYPSAKQAEMREVLQAACDVRYSQCKFPMCPLEGREVGVAVTLLLGGDESVSSAAASSAVSLIVSSAAVASAPAELTNGEEKDWAFYRSLLAQLAAERRALIAEAEKREKEQKLVWQRFVIPEDVQEEREELLRDSKKSESKHYESTPLTPPTAPPQSPGTKPTSAVPSTVQSTGPSKGAGNDATGNWFDQDAANLQIGVLPPLPAAPPVDPHRRK